MRIPNRYQVIASCAALMFNGVVWSQVSGDIRAQLDRGGFARAESWVYASASGLMRGSREAEEDRQATRAMQALAHALCQHQPAAGKRLEAGIRGMSMVSSTQRGREIEVVMRAPVQEPVCRVVAVTAPRPPDADVAAEASRTGPAAESGGATQVLDPVYSREKNMTVRIYGGEY